MKESEIRDFIVEYFSSFCDFINNKEQFELDLTKEEELIYAGRDDLSEILISDLVKLSTIEKLKLGLPILSNLELLGKEFVLLKTPRSQGKQPSVDIMAYNKENYCLALIELKISSRSERECITELSAYNQGLQNKFRGLSSLEVLWIPISTEWRTTTNSAVEYEMFWQNTMVLPLKLSGNYSEQISKFKHLEFELFNPTQDLIEAECRNLFSYECFDAYDYVTEDEISDKNAFVNVISSVFSRQKINGFIIFHEPCQLQFPYGFTLCVYNPYKGYIHKKISRQFIDDNSEEEFLRLLAENMIINTEYQDIDFLTDEIKKFEPLESDMDGTGIRFDAYWDKKFLSVGEFADNNDNQNISFMLDKIQQMLNSFRINPSALGNPNFDMLFNNLRNAEVDSVIYLGIHLELISKRVLIEHRRGLHEWDYFSTISSFSYLRSLFQEYNLR
jgi:hypothetical protein